MAQVGVIDRLMESAERNIPERVLACAAWTAAAAFVAVIVAALVLVGVPCAAIRWLRG